MDVFRFIRSSFHAPPTIRCLLHRRRDGRRGFALILALGLAALYFMLIELMMIDASRELGEARRFRSRVVALTLAENGAELVARSMVVAAAGTEDEQSEDWQGMISGHLRKKIDGSFEITGRGRSIGIESTRAWVRLEGRVAGTQVLITHSRHTQ